jgi:hypothetical protein
MFKHGIYLFAKNQLYHYFGWLNFSQLVLLTLSSFFVILIGTSSGEYLTTSLLHYLNCSETTSYDLPHLHSHFSPIYSIHYDDCHGLLILFIFCQFSSVMQFPSITKYELQNKVFASSSIGCSHCFVPPPNSSSPTSNSV